MTISFSIEVPDALGQQLQTMQDRLPEILERGMRDVLAEQTATFHDAAEIIAVLASQPTPDQILNLQPSPALQERVRDLLARNQQGMLSAQEHAELERYALLEHLVRMAKAHAYKQLAQAQ
jgi:hypothetical protein